MTPGAIEKLREALRRARGQGSDWDARKTLHEAVLDFLAESTAPVPCVEWSGKDVDALLAAFERDKASAIRAARKEALEEAATIAEGFAVPKEKMAGPRTESQDLTARMVTFAIRNRANLSGSEDKNTTQEGA